MSDCVAKICLLLCLSTALGCASVTKVYDDVMHEIEPTGVDGRFYVAKEGLPLYEEPNFASPQIAALELEEAVDRDGLDSGFAHVRVVGTGKTGWVDNAKLNWRAPGADEDAETDAKPVEESPQPEPTAAAPVATPKPKLAPPPTPKDGAAPGDENNVDPALFDAF